jgi:4-hydroxy-tetrahydrodipicolinate synthase
MFSGSIPALVTPFDADGAFDEGAFRDLVEWQIAEGSSALVPCGTTGEAATLSAEEHFHVVRVCVDQTKGRVPVIAGAGSNDTRVAIANIKASKESAPMPR